MSRLQCAFGIFALEDLLEWNRGDVNLVFRCLGLLYLRSRLDRFLLLFLFVLLLGLLFLLVLGLFGLLLFVLLLFVRVFVGLLVLTVVPRELLCLSLVVRDVDDVLVGDARVSLFRVVLLVVLLER